ncbi:hypothetical protein MADA3029_250002 [Vibrio nigripulchritudo MADA3029]|nr:hypothetical protein VIBNIMADA3020_940002 [Vibrio nigripulchritudo MADA3020]CCN51838.1 hypothetical protein VIBNIMADA3021_1170002 [Vibrio nigripulchritudo MADA3021]CCN58720.1 hypothetical protein MADA3029_250002 [Vibrio nigripulchritudo MADA3029]
MIPLLIEFTVPEPGAKLNIVAVAMYIKRIWRSILTTFYPSHLALQYH